jgi:hypothetical protein
MHFSSYIDRFIAYAQSRLMGLHPLGEGDSRPRFGSDRRHRQVSTDLFLGFWSDGRRKNVTEAWAVTKGAICFENVHL